VAVRVLVADDEEFILEFLEAVLGEHPDFEVVALCRDGAEAVRRAEETNPDLCLLDVRMPGLDGIQACERILARLPHALVLMISGLANEEYVSKAKAAGARDFLPKPFRIDDVEGVLVRNAREAGLLPGA